MKYYLPDSSHRDFSGREQRFIRGIFQEYTHLRIIYLPIYLPICLSTIRCELSNSSIRYELLKFEVGMFYCENLFWRVALDKYERHISGPIEYF